MTVEEIFTKLNAHMLEGTMTHEQLANYYQFLALDGYKCCHEYHFLSEMLSYRQIQKFYIDNFNKLIPDTKLVNPSIIPADWYKHSRGDITGAAKQEYVKNAMELWKKWEEDTCKLYCDFYQELKTLKEYSATYMIKNLIYDVEREKAEINKKMLELNSMNYSIEYILGQQKLREQEYSLKKKRLL